MHLRMTDSGSRGGKPFLTTPIVLFLLALSPSLLAQGPTWYSTSWSYRKAITIDHTRVSGSAALTNFPALISVTDTDLAAGAQSSGHDILFTASDGTSKLNHEVETYTSSNGKLTAWVQVPSVSPITDTIIYVYYGNSSATDQQNKAGVWDANYSGVWHMGDSTTLTADDSTTNGNDASSLNGTSATAGQIGGGASFAAGSSQYIDTGNSASLQITGSLTAETWINVTGNGINYPRFLGKGSINSSGWFFFKMDSTDDRVLFQIQGTNLASTNAISRNAWHHVVGVYDGSQMKLFIDGASAASPQTKTGAIDTSGHNLQIGAETGGGSWLQGSMDEVRVSNTSRTGDWITTEYNNQASPGTFYTTAGVEGQSGQLVGTPIYSPAVGTYPSAQSVTISSATSGAVIYYTTDGSTPTTSSTQYSGAIGVTASATLKAIAVKSGLGNSEMGTATYSITGSSWYTSWSYRKGIIIDHTKLSGSATLTNFPVLISITDTDLAAGAQSSAHDILFTAADGATKLSHEVEAYNSSTGKLSAWVQVPSLSPTADTIIYVYYGNPSATDQQNKTGVWDSNYSGVWHLGDGVTLTANDSTSNGNNASSLNGSSATSGQIAGAATFSSASNQYIDTGDTTSLQITGSITAETWINVTGDGINYPRFLGKGAINSSGWFFYKQNSTDDRITFQIQGTNLASTNAVSRNAWHHLVGVYDGSEMKLFIDGAFAASQAKTGAINTSGHDLQIGAEASGGSWLQGSMDEVRVSNTSRTGDWITTEYTNQASPDTFVSLDVAQGANGPVVGKPTFSPAGGTYSAAQNVTISSATSGASIRYTTDGSTPSETVGTLYSGAITVSSAATLKAIAYASGSTDSVVASAAYVLQVTAPTFSPTPGTYTSIQTVTISSSTSGASIRYTTDGSTPTETVGTLYSGPVTVSNTATLKAIAYTAGVTDSSVASATYTIAGSSWYNSSWNYRKAIIIDHTKVTGSTSLTNFPMLVSVTDTDLAVGTQSSGHDILFTASDGATKLNHEIETYTSSSGKLTAWVQVPSLSPTADTAIYVYYGNASAADQQNKTGVWDSSYGGVWHLGDGSTLTANDSTSNGANGTVTSASAVGGQISGAASFTPSSWIGLGINVSETSYNVSGWFKTSAATTGLWQVDCNDRGGCGSDRYVFLSSGNVCAHIYSDEMVCTSGTNYSDGNWHYVVHELGGSVGGQRIFVDGQPGATGSKANSDFTWQTGMTLGYAGNGGYLSGSLDEFHVSSSVRTSGWIATEYNNQGSPSTFYSLGGAEGASGPVVGTPTYSPGGGSYTSGQSVTISSATSGATIYYTTDGSTPTTSSTQYSGAISVSANTTLNALAVKSGMTDSGVATATYAIAGTSWYNTSWSNRKGITIDHTKVSGSTALTSFPVLISVTDADIAAGAQSGGQDILFTAADGATKLNHEIDTYTSSNGKLTAWVQVPSLSPTADTVIYVYYGNASATDQQNKTGVWDSNYSGVWHLGDGSTLTANDSTSNGNNASSLNGASAAAAQIGGGASFSAGSSQHIDTGDTSSLQITGSLTAETWINVTGDGINYPRFLGKGSINSTGWFFFKLNATDDHILFQVQGTNLASTNAVSRNAWHHVVGVYDGSQMKLYIDGASAVSPGTKTGAINTSGHNLQIGAESAGGSWLQGDMDEVRVSNTSRTGDWIATEYNNQASPGTFYSLSGAQGGSGSVVGTPAYSPSGGTYSSAQTVTISSATSGAAIYYTTNGSSPTTSSTPYSVAISIAANTTLKAIAVKSGMTNSGIRAESYAIVVATPSFNPSSGTYSSSPTVTISTSTSGASIRYTVDGSTPSDTAGSVYSAPISISASTTLKAIAYASGLTNSGVATAAYNISATTPSITSVTPTSGASGTQVTISGSGFGSAHGTGTVWLGSTLGVVVSWGSTQIVATVANNAQSGAVQVQQGGAWSNAVSFTVSTVTISSITPTSGVAGTQVTITGAGFGASQGSGQVWLGSAGGAVQSWSDTQVVAQVASGAASGQVRILQNGVISNAISFTVNTPHITSISPTSGSPGTSVTITGTGFGSSQGAGAVLLGSTAGLVNSWSDTQVVAVVASSSLTGIARIQQNGIWSNAIGFTVPVSGSSVTLVPNMLNLVVGDTHTIQALGSNGQSVTGLTWASSDSTVVSLSSDVPPILSALTAGHVTITAGTASTDVTVSAGALPLGAVLWSNPGNGSGVSKIVPAVPSVAGVADVFAFQNDGTVQAITSDGTTAWIADASNATTIIPDFQGGLVQVHSNANGPGGSIGKFDGITGQFQTLYTGTTTRVLAAATDGTIFTLIKNEDNSLSVIGIDPDAGSLKFSVPVPHTTLIENAEGPAFPEGVSYAIAGDGYFYLTTGWTTPFQEGAPPATYHVRMMRVNSSGASDSSEVYTSQSATPGDFFQINPTMISNGDTGVLLSFVDYNTSYDTHLVTTTGTSVVQVGTIPSPPAQNGAIVPVLQAQDGSFVGRRFYNGQYNMIAFDGSGSIHWNVPNEQPQIATADGQVVGQSGITYDANGNATGQTAMLPIYSWNGNAYQQQGSVQQISADFLFYLYDLASNFWPTLGGNYSDNGTSYSLIRTFQNNVVNPTVTVTNPSQQIPTSRPSQML